MNVFDSEYNHLKAPEKHLGGGEDETIIYCVSPVCQAVC